MEQIQRDIQIEALTVYYFLLEFVQFEKKMKDIFRQALEQQNENDQEFIQKLYFFAGAMASKKIYIDFEGEKIAYDSQKVKKCSDLMTSFTLNQWVKIEKRWHFVELIPLEISSINHPKEKYNFYECCDKLIQMRNILVHEFSNMKNDSKYVIEILSNQNLERYLPMWLNGYGTDNFNENTKKILSNLIMMCEMKKQIAKRI